MKLAQDYIRLRRLPISFCLSLSFLTAVDRQVIVVVVVVAVVVIVVVIVVVVVVVVVFVVIIDLVVVFTRSFRFCRRHCGIH